MRRSMKRVRHLPIRGIGELESLRDRIVGFAVSAGQNNASLVS